MRLTPWERYMALDHGPRHGMTCFSRFWLSRPVDRDAFRAAVVAVARDNPFLAVTRRGRSWAPLAFDPERQIDWAESPAAIEWRHLHPSDSLVYWTARVGRLGTLGLADGVHDDLTGTVVVVRYAHAVADGLAAAAALAQVCGILAGAAPAPPSPADLAARHALAGPPATVRARLGREIGRIARYFLRWPVEFAPDGKRVAGTSPPDIAFTRTAASTAVTSAHVAAGRDAGASLNDVLLAALFRALAPHLDRASVIRIAVPTSLRPEGNAAFCNQVSMVFLDRVAARVTSTGLLGGVATEMTTVKRWRLGHAMHSFLSVALAAGDLPLHWFMRLPVVSTTAVLSNVGDPFAATDPAAAIRVVAHDAFSPLRPGTNLALVAARRDGRLSLTLRFDPDRVSRARAERLLDDTLAAATHMLGIGRVPD